ncbi:hypothetical protein HPT25_22690 [Bacillus sp. BRMEA1]|uniref:hypothetical protein n=1 Tax=Neobacillus endophyticus TaxID=2738405 RepID=UPI001565B074|nr:hypothetical protein [Neobacillus endophyticus]NRD80148.1 hypothetical protein [Neobacillus endophyticus]
MIRSHSLDLQASKAVFNKLKSRIERHMCYNNIWNVFSSHQWKFIRNDWRIAYGFVSILNDPRMLARHCFIVDRKGKAIDPTIFCFDHFKENEEISYFSFAVLDKNEYLTCLEMDDYDPSLHTACKPAEHEMYLWAKKQRLYLL